MDPDKSIKKKWFPLLVSSFTYNLSSKKEVSSCIIFIHIIHTHMLGKEFTA